jgi:hypothetical protein
MRRISIFVLFGAAFALLSACSQAPDAVTLEASGGAYVRQITPGSNQVTRGTAVVVKLRTVSGGLVRTPINVSVTGPNGWNDDRSASFTYPAEAFWVVAPERAAPPVSGTYRVEAEANGQRVTTSFTIADPGQELSLTTISAQAQGQPPQQSVAASWTAVPDASGYYARVLNGSTLVPASEDVFTVTPQATLSVGTLEPDAAYFGIVYAANFDTTAESPLLPAQLSLSDSIVTVEASTSSASRSVLGRVDDSVKPAFWKQRSNR